MSKTEEVDVKSGKDLLVSVDWSWHKLMHFLHGDDSAGEREVCKNLLELQRDSYRELREAIVDPGSSVSWRAPFLTRFLSFPYEWDVEASLSQIELGPSRHLASMYLALSALTAGRAVTKKHGVLVPLVPWATRMSVKSFPKDKIVKLYRAWFQSREFCAPVLYGDNNISNPDDRTLIGRGKTGEFEASLQFLVSPRYIDHEKKFSMYCLSVGLPWVASSEALDPDVWTRNERDCFWGLIDEFFDLCLRPEGALDASSSIERRLEGGSEIDSFEARFAGPTGYTYVDKCKPCRIEFTPWRNVPLYARGLEGPKLEVSNGQGGFRHNPFRYILAAMLYPDSHEKRHRYVISSRVQEALHRHRADWRSDRT